MNRNVKIIIINNKPWTSVAFVQDIYPLFLAKNEISFKVATFGGSLFSGGGVATLGFAYTCDILSLLSRGRYFWNFTVLCSLHSRSVLLQ